MARHRGTNKTRYITKSKANKTMGYSTISLTRVGKAQNIAHVQLNRPKQGNSMTKAFFEEIKACFEALSKDTSYRVVVLSAVGKYFSVGLDLKETSLGKSPSKEEESDTARTTYRYYNNILGGQAAFSALEKCPQPVIMCMHGVCVGGSVDLACAADIRLCSEDAWYCIKEVDIAASADLGTLQRIEKTIGSSSLVRELCYTARRMHAEEAKSCGFVSHVYKNQEECVQEGMKMAEIIATKSPIAIVGTKMNLNYSRDHPTNDSLQFQAIWNGAMAQTGDTKKAVIASLKKQDQPEFAKL